MQLNNIVKIVGIQSWRLICFLTSLLWKIFVALCGFLKEAVIAFFGDGKKYCKEIETGPRHDSPGEANLNPKPGEPMLRGYSDPHDESGKYG